MKANKIYIGITVVLTLGFILLGIFVFNSSYLRLFETVRNLINSFKFYFCALFGIPNNTEPTVIQYSNLLKWDTVLPSDFENFKVSSADYFSLLFSLDNFKAWGIHLGGKLESASKIIAILLPCLFALFFAIKRLYGKSNTNYNVDTLPLKAVKQFSRLTYNPVKRFITSYLAFHKQYSWILKCWIAMWILQFNIASVLIEFVAFYFYFVIAFRFDILYVYICKLFIDLQVIFRFFKWWGLIPIAWILFERFRRRIATSRLRHFEACNCGFINELPIVSITCGSMGKKKTTAITDMTLSQEVMFRQKAMELMQKNDMKFPQFPWICFEKELQKCLEYGTVYNLATVKEWVKKKRARFEKHGRTDLQLYGYDIYKYGICYDDCLKISSLFEVLETYAQAYFIYVIQSSLIVSNYSIRTDNAFVDEGNFPIWLFDFFPKRYKVNSRHSHILDFDVLRLGRKVMENNLKAGSFEFGVVAISEIGKERGNNLELKEVKKGQDETNQKNDLFNSWLKMCRHSATVDNFPFIKVFTDEQRPESWGADARDLCEIVKIADSSEQKLALPFYTIEEMISEWIFNWFINLYYDFRFRRGDNTLLVYLLKKVTALIFKRNIRIHNRYGFSTLKIEKERGTMDGKVEKKIYYLMSKKIYSRRFSTDCFSDYFNELAKKSKVGLNDYREYATEKASIIELQEQNSYFINSLYKASEKDSD